MVLGVQNLPGPYNFNPKAFTSVYIRERAAADEDFAGLGQIYIKDDIPNTAWFADDTGEEYQLGVANRAESQTVNLLQSDTTAQKQVKIDAVGKYIPYGNTVIFQFEVTKTYTETVALEFSGFYGGGIVAVYGNTTQVGAGARRQTHDTIIDVSGQNVRGMDFFSNSVDIIVKDIRIDIANHASANGIRFQDCPMLCHVQWCYLVADAGSNNSIGVIFIGCPTALLQGTEFNDTELGLYAIRSKVYDTDNASTTNDPGTGYTSTDGSTIARQGAGSVIGGGDSFGTGGVIR